MKKILFILLLISTFFGCRKNTNYDFTTHTARGKIIAITKACDFEKVVIEVESQDGLGVEGYYNFYSESDKEIQVISYKNAIAVPYFSKIALDVQKEKVGTLITFKYRELNDKEESLFIPKEPMACPTVAIIKFPKKFIITEIIK